MDNHRNDQTDIPEWLKKNENYIPQSDKDTFVNKSILSLLKIISRIKAQNSAGDGKYEVNVHLKIAFTLLLILLLSISKSFSFIIIMNVYLLLILSSMQADNIIKILKLSIGMALLTFAVMLPAVFWGNSSTCITITSKVFASITAVGILSHTEKWGSITTALKRFFIPDIIILVLDITIRYIVMLGDFSLNMLYSLKLRSVGKNKSKYTSLSGIAGSMFIKSKEMAEEMYYAMECRGFTGEYHVYSKSKFKLADYIFIIINIGIILIFLYFGS